MFHKLPDQSTEHASCFFAMVQPEVDRRSFFHLHGCVSHLYIQKTTIRQGMEGSSRAAAPVG